MGFFPSREKKKGAVLIFLPGEFEIATMIKSFKAHDPDNNEQLIFFPLHSRMPFDDTKKIFDSVPDGYRKIIISTNMAESSVTIPDISFVIDFCLTKKLVCDPSTNYRYMLNIFFRIQQIIVENVPVHCNWFGPTKIVVSNEKAEQDV